MHIKWIVFEFWAGFGVWVHVCTWHRAVSPAPVTTAPISPAHISPTHVSTTALSPQCYLHKLSQFLSPLLHQEKKPPWLSPLFRRYTPLSVSVVPPASSPRKASLSPVGSYHAVMGPSSWPWEGECHEGFLRKRQEVDGGPVPGWHKCS